jgi:signal transduction histidine kinase
LEDMTVSSDNYKDTQWKQSTEIRIGETVVGSLEVCYLTEKPEADEGPFLIDERRFLDTVGAELLSNYMEHHQILLQKEQQHRELELYSSLLRHDLRNDIGVIMGNLEITRMTILNRDDSLNQLLSTTDAVCQRMMNLLNVFGRAAKVTDSNLVSMVEKVIERTREANLEMTVNLVVENDAKGAKILESKLLSLVFDNLLRNVATHVGSSATVTVTISRKDRLLRVLVEDDGPGVANEVKDKLFQKGVSTRGGGLGLYLSRNVVETIGGTIKLIESRPGTGATFEIIIPTLR